MSSWFVICEKCNKPINKGTTKCPHCGYTLSKIIQPTSIKKSIRLNNLDGLEFENLVEEIFKLNGYNVINIQYVSDEGRDLIVEKNGRRTLIECKHQKGTIGRPVVQKLHSAVIVDKKAENGIICTTGTMSKQALDYAQQNSVPIEFYELPKLRILADNANIKLLLEGENPEKGIYELNDSDVTKNSLIRSLTKKIITKPNNVDSLINDIDIKINLIPTYRIEYQVRHKTINSSGTTLYNVNKNGVLHINANNLQIYDMNQDYLKDALILNNSINSNVNSLKTTYIYNDEKTIKPVKTHLKRKYSTSITYYGNNNVRYDKFCEIIDKEIFIQNITPVYLPLQKLMLKLLYKNYAAEFIEKKNYAPLITHHNLSICQICNKETESAQLCNSCGSITHLQIWSKRKSHGYTCDECGKTICRNCGYWARKGIIFKKVICRDCLQKNHHQDTKFSKIPSLSNTLSDYFI